MVETDGHQSRVNLINSKTDLAIPENELYEVNEGGTSNEVYEAEEADHGSKVTLGGFF